MAVAGPVASFVLALIFWQAENLALARAWPTPVVGVADTLRYINVVVAIFNLLPAFPLDGGRMFRAALWHFKKDMRAATYISSRIGRGFGLFMMILGVFGAIQGNFIGGMWWFLIGMFLRGAAAASYQQLMLQDVLKDKPVREFMNSEPVTVPPSISVADWVEEYVYRHHYKLFPVVEDSSLLGSISIDKIKKIPREEWDRRNVRELMEPVSPANSIPADTETTKLLMTMIRPDTPSRFMVVEGGRLVGMISLKDLLELIALKLEIESP
jgi:CBS domain-containing protein